MWSMRGPRLRRKLAWGVVAREVLAQGRQPGELARVAVRPEWRAVRHVDVDDPHAPHGGGDQPRGRGPTIRGEAVLHRGALLAGEDRDTVVARLTEHHRAVAELGEGVRRE